MKSILIKTLPYLIVFFVINIFIYKTSHFYNQEREYTTKIDSVINNPKAKVIFLGDSHPKTIELLNLSENIGNLAFGADGIKEMYIKTMISNKHIKELQYVFISTEPQMFNSSISSNSTFLNKYLINLDEYSKNIYKKTTLNLITEKAPFLNDNYILYFLNSIHSKINNLFKNKSSDNKNTKKWSELTENQRKEQAIATGKFDHVAIMLNTDDLKLYKDLINKLQSKNIKVIGIRFPVNSNYLEQCNKEDLRKVNTFINTLKLDYNLDYSLSIKDPSYYINEDHLNKKGMKKLSELIFNDTGINLNKKN